MIIKPAQARPPIFPIGPSAALIHCSTTNAFGERNEGDLDILMRERQCVPGGYLSKVIEGDAENPRGTAGVVADRHHDALPHPRAAEFEEDAPDRMQHKLFPDDAAIVPAD